MSNPTNAAIVALMKEQILEDIAAGVVPVTVNSFSELHDYCDANTYGDPLVIERERAGESWSDFIPEVQNEVDAWLKNGHPTDEPQPEPEKLTPRIAAKVTARALTDSQEARSDYRRAVAERNDERRLHALRRVLNAERILVRSARGVF